MIYFKALRQASFFFTFAAGLLLPAQSKADVEEQSWSSFQITDQYRENVSLYGEWINRYSHESDEFVTQSVRLGLIFKLDEKWSYGFIVESRQTDSSSNDEMRYINQLSRKWNFDKLALSVRGRYELREFADSKKIANRLRALGRVDGTDYQFWGLTPFALSEYFYIANSVGSRPEGSTEIRHQIGVARDLLGGVAELGYLDRTTDVPKYKGNPARKTEYGIANFVLKWSY